MPQQSDILVEMAVVLCTVPELDDDFDCRVALFRAGFQPLTILAGLRQARALARSARTPWREFCIARSRP